MCVSFSLSLSLSLFLLIFLSIFISISISISFCLSHTHTHTHTHSHTLTPPTLSGASTSSGGRVFASPLAKVTAAKAGVALNAITGSPLCLFFRIRYPFRDALGPIGHDHARKWFCRPFLLMNLFSSLVPHTHDVFGCSRFVMPLERSHDETLFPLQVRVPTTES